MKIKDIVKLVKSIILLASILLIGISTVTGSINANARQEEIKNLELYNNPEAILNVVFKDNVYLDNIIDNELNPDRNWQGLTFDKSRMGISNVSGLSAIGGVDEMISINGQFSSRSVKRSYNNKLQELITKIDDIKNNNQYNDNDIIKTELSKMNGWEVKKQRYVNWSQSKILQLSLIGYTDTIETVKNILEKSGHTKNINFSITKSIKESLNNIEEVIKKNKDILNSDDYLSIVKKELGFSEKEQIAFEESIKTQPDNVLKPIQNELDETETNSVETSTSRNINGLLNGLNAKAAGGWDMKLGADWCGWSPCGFRIFIGKVHWNSLVGNISSGIAMGTIIAGKSWWMYNVLSKVTWICGPAVVNCNIALLVITTMLAGYLAASTPSFENQCRYANWASGIRYRASFKGGLGLKECANDI